MLNSQDLEELKIEALANNSRQSYSLHCFSDLAPALSSASGDHFVIKHSSNSNLFAFTFILLSNIFESRSPLYHQSLNNGSPHSQDVSGLMQSPHTNNVKTNQIEQNKNCFSRAKKLYEFLICQKINFAEIKNMPQTLVFALSNCLKNQKPSVINIYLKKLLVQFLQELELGRDYHFRQGWKYQEDGKQTMVYKYFRKYPICQSLFNMFIRCVLSSEYEIMEALDYNKHVSDHTVYTALCDAFLYSSLHIEDNYTEISSGNFIRPIRLKNKHKQMVFYWISTPQYKSESIPPKEILGSDTFRVRKKSSDVSSNNQSISFRQTSKAFHPQPQHSVQNRYSNKKQNILRLNQNIDVKPNAADLSSKPNPEIEQERKKIEEKNEMLSKIKSENKIRKNEQDKKLQKSLSEQKVGPNNGRKQEERVKPGLNGYTSLEILKELNPTVRESMLKTINYFKKYQP